MHIKRSASGEVAGEDERRSKVPRLGEPEKTADVEMEDVKVSSAARNPT